jgi:uncharacterized protein YndB with AHSA1/START domain
MTTSTTDRIEKNVLIRAPKSRVWRALTDSAEFGTWFRAKLDAGFAPGRRVTGRVTHPGYEHVKFDVLVERMEPERFFSFRWHPCAIDPKVDYSKEPTTLVELTLAETKEGTLLTVVESGFDQVPAWRRDEAFRLNTAGWVAQLENVKRHVAG